jgi:hypothetical protein
VFVFRDRCWDRGSHLPLCRGVSGDKGSRSSRGSSAGVNRSHETSKKLEDGKRGGPRGRILYQHFVQVCMQSPMVGLDRFGHVSDPAGVAGFPIEEPRTLFDAVSKPVPVH